MSASSPSSTVTDGDTLSGSSTGPSSSPTSTGSANTTTTSDSSSLPPTSTITDGSTATSSPGTPSSSLYLFTFLATLFLLLAISSAIIMRGIFLRRRFRRRIEEAIAAGVLLSPSDDGSGFGGTRSPRRRLHRPTLYDVSVLPPYFSTSAPQDATWEKITPFSANISAEKPTTEPVTETDSPPPVPPAGRRRRGGSSPSVREQLESFGLIPRRLRRPRTDLSANAGSSSNESSSALTATAAAAAAAAPAAGPPQPVVNIPLEPLDPVERAAEACVAVVIAMPNPHRTGYLPPAVDEEVHLLAPAGKGKARGLDGGWGEEHEEEGVPDVVFGVAKVPVLAPVQDADESPDRGAV